MEKQIPTIEVEIGKEKKKVLVYKWLTLEESADYSDIALEDTDITDEEAIRNKVLTSKIYAKLNTYLIQKMCINPAWEEINQWNPGDREELIEYLRGLLEKN